MVEKRAGVHARFVEILCLAVLGIILSLGLWPFHVPVNDVTWLRTGNGLRLGHYSTVIGATPLEDAAADGAGGSGSVEIWVEPVRIWTGGTFLSFSQAGHAKGLRIQQSLIDLALDASSPSET